MSEEAAPNPDSKEEVAEDIVALKSRHVIFKEHKTAAEAVELVDEELGDLGDKDVLLKMQFASVNPADINYIEGVYGRRPSSMPAIAGLEAVGIVDGVGKEVTDLTVGDLVRPMVEGQWRSRVILPAEKCLKFPRDINSEQAAMIYVNPSTAWRMLHDFVELKQGDWVIQNASNSAVGRCAIQICRSKGIKTVNLVRRLSLENELKAIGADVVIPDDAEAAKKVLTATGGTRPVLGLNGVGGDSAINLMRCLKQGGKIVTYGAMSRQALKVPAGMLIFMDQSYHGFWMNRWYETAPKEEVDKMYSELARLFSSGALTVPVEKIYPIDSVKEAVAHAQQEKKGGKILLKLTPQA